MTTPTKNWPENLNKQERIDSAKSKVEKLVNRLRLASATRASNRIMQFPKGRTGSSKAAVCYNILMENQFKYESLVLASLWDKAIIDRNSIPTIIRLVNDRKILKTLRQDAEMQYTPEYAEFRQDEIEKFNTRWTTAVEISKRLPDDPKFKELLDYRNHEIAHSLTIEQIVVDPNVIRLAGPFWEDTISCVSSLYSAITLKDFDFEGSKKLHESYAVDFWQNLRLTSPDGN
jgi:AbiU2